MKVYNLTQELKEQNAGIFLTNIREYKALNLGLTNVLSHLFFTKVAPKHLERLVSDVLEAKLTTGNRFKIQFRTVDGKKKSIEYEANDHKTACKIVSKLEFLKYAILKILEG